jgi:hypothetical protein
MNAAISSGWISTFELEDLKLKCCPAPNPGSRICCGGGDLKQSRSGGFCGEWSAERRVAEIEQTIERNCALEEAVKHDGRSILYVYHCHLFVVSIPFGLAI